MSHQLSASEFARLSALYRCGVLDTPDDAAFDAVLQNLVAALDVPVAQVAFADARRFWAKSTVGLMDRESLRGRGLLEQAITHGPELLCAASGIGDMPSSPLALQWFAGLPVAGPNDEIIGVVFVADTRARTFEDEARPALALAAVRLRALVEQRQHAREDTATGALTRDAFMEQAQRLMDVSRVSRQPVSLVTFGLAPLLSALGRKASGLDSLVLQQMADLGRTQVRQRDSFGRLGEDQFAVLLSDTDASGASVLAQRLSDTIEHAWRAGGFGAPQVAIGIADIKPGSASETAESLLHRAGELGGGIEVPHARVA